MKSAVLLFASLMLLSSCMTYTQKTTQPSELEWHSLLYDDSIAQFAIGAQYNGSLCANLYMRPLDRSRTISAVVIDADGNISFETKNSQKCTMKIVHSEGASLNSFQESAFLPVYAPLKENSLEAVLCYCIVLLGCKDLSYSLENDSVVDVHYSLKIRILVNGSDTLTISNSNTLTPGRWHAQASEENCP